MDLCAALSIRTMHDSNDGTRTHAHACVKKAAVIELLLSSAPRASQQPEPEPEPAPPAPSKAADQSDHPVYRALESHQLDQHFDKLFELGVKRVEDLEQLTQAELEELDMKRFDRPKFMSAFITEVPHHGVSSSVKDSRAVTAAAGGFSFEGREGGKHTMFSYQCECTCLPHSAELSLS